MKTENLMVYLSQEYKEFLFHRYLRLYTTQCDQNLNIDGTFAKRPLQTLRKTMQIMSDLQIILETHNNPFKFKQSTRSPGF